MNRNLKCRDISIVIMSQLNRMFDGIEENLPTHLRIFQMKSHRIVVRLNDIEMNLYENGRMMHVIPMHKNMSYLVLLRLRIKWLMLTLKKSKRHRRQSTPHSSSSSSSLLNPGDTSSLSTELHNHKAKAPPSNSISLSSNNSAFVYLQSKKPNDNIECKIS